MLAADLLDVWERGDSALPAERALMLLSIAQPQVRDETLTAWTVGERNAALFALRGRVFGPRLSALTDCPKCSEALEIELAASDLLVTADDETPPSLSLERAGYQVTY